MPEKELELKASALARIGVNLKKEFTATEIKRMSFKEVEMIEGLRQYKGVYDPETLIKIRQNKSTVYPRYTRSKVVPLVAKLNNLLFPDNDRNWEIRPTPNPELNKEQIAEIVKTMPIEDEQGEALEISQENIDAAILDFSKKTIDRMTTEMDDQLVEANYQTKAKAVIRSGVMFGTGIFKGPLAQNKIKRSVTKGDKGFEQKETKEFKPHVGDVSIWRWYPDMSSTELDGCNFVFELHSKTKHELRKLAKRKNFKADVINSYIRTNPDGDYKVRTWESDLSAIKNEEDTKFPSKNYEVLEYNGYLDGQELLRAGVIKEGDKRADSDQFVNIWLLGGKVIKAIIHPVESLTDLYHLFYLEKDDSSIFGEGLPRIIRDTQISICSGTRAMLDNAAWVAGPIFEMNGDLMPDEEMDDVYPGRSFEREGRGADAQYPALRVYDIKSSIPDYLALIDRFERTGDMESTIPAFLFGEAAKTTNETSKGISIRQSNTNLTINDVVKNFDLGNESFLKALYAWNMEYNKDASIKGDMEIKAIGSSSLVSKESRTQALDQLQQTLDDEDKKYIKRRPNLAERYKMHDLDPEKLLYTEKEKLARDAAAVNPEAIDLEKRSREAEIRYDHAKAGNMEAKASETTQGISMKELEVMATIIEKIRGGKNEKDGDSGNA